MMEAAAKARKDADHREELRRINRAWNAKAEGEKKRIEMERRIREVEKQKRTLAAQKSSQPHDRCTSSHPPQFNPSSTSYGSSITLPISSANSFSQGQYDFNVIQQQFFPPLGCSGSPQTAIIDSDYRNHLHHQQRGHSERFLEPRQPLRSHPESASVSSNSELSADGLNRRAKEFVPKFAVVSHFDLRNDANSLLSSGSTQRGKLATTFS